MFIPGDSEWNENNAIGVFLRQVYDKKIIECYYFYIRSHSTIPGSQADISEPRAKKRYDMKTAM